jgi:hypothetical protein
MSQKQDDYPEQEAQIRLQKIMRGAFDGAPTPLKDIPNRQGKQRAKRKIQPPRPRQGKHQAV